MLHNKYNAETPPFQYVLDLQS